MKTLKTLKITYWASTGLFCCVFLFTGTSYLLHTQIMDTKFHEIGFPLYIMNLIGILKIAGAITLLVPKYPRLKEWAYAGFVFDFVGAAWCHFAVQGFGQGVRLVIPIAVVSISYFTYHRLNDQPRLSTSVADEHSAL
jgi:uncharacterized membrane protein YphA (DoxX/SURF4 family)